MKIYIITKEPFPYGMAATNRILCYAKGIIANGMDCEVLIAKRTEYLSGSNGNTKKIGIYQDIPFKYIPSTLYRNKNLLIRKYFDFFDLFRLMRFSQKHFQKGDILLDFTNSIVLELVTKILSIKYKTPVIRELCEYPFAPRKNNLFYRVNQWIMLQAVFPCFDGFIVISENLKHVAERYGSKRSKIIKVPIMVDREQVQKVKAFTSNEPYIFHAGTLSEQKDAFVSTLQAFAIAIEQLNLPIKYFVAGEDKTHWEEIQSMIKLNKMEDNIVFLGKISHQEVLSYWKGASLAILNKNDNLQNRNGFSTKLGEILWSETAVITTTVGEANRYLQDGETAYIVEPHKPELIAEKIVQAFTFEDERKRIACNGKLLAEKEFDAVYQGKRIVEFFRKILN